MINDTNKNKETDNIDDQIEQDEYEFSNKKCRHFVAYSGVKLPLKLVNQLDDADMGHRNTFIRGYYDEQDRLVVCQKVVYSEVEFEHRYEYNDEGVLQRAIITEAYGEPMEMRLDPQGKIVAE